MSAASSRPEAAARVRIRISTAALAAGAIGIAAAFTPFSPLAIGAGLTAVVLGVTALSFRRSLRRIGLVGAAAGILASALAIAAVVGGLTGVRAVPGLAAGIGIRSTSPPALALPDGGTADGVTRNADGGGGSRDATTTSLGELYGTFSSQRVSKTGDAEFELPPGVAAGLITATTRTAGPLRIDVVDADGRVLATPVHSAGDYSGQTSWGLDLDTAAAHALRVTATGGWTVVLEPLSRAGKLPADRTAAYQTGGAGDRVFIVAAGTTWAVEGAGEIVVESVAMGTSGWQVSLDAIDPGGLTATVGDAAHADRMIVQVLAKGDFTLVSDGGEG